MLMDLFSTFDPAAYSLHSIIPSFWWATNFFHIMLAMPTFFSGGSRFMTFMRLYIGYLIHWVDSKNTLHIKGMTLILASSITLTLATNIIGQLPYTYPITVSPVFSMTMCLPVWLGMVFSSLVYAPSHFLGSLIPLSTPIVLTPIVTTAELMSNLVRPVSHCARLTINTTLGHLYLKLAASFSMYSIVQPSGPSLSSLMLIMLSVFLIFFEALMALLQSYIFCFLLTIYVTDHPQSAAPLSSDKAFMYVQKHKDLSQDNEYSFKVNTPV